VFGFITFVAAYSVPYVITGVMPLYHFIHTLSFGMHLFNGMTALLLISVRGYKPEYKHILKYIVLMSVIVMIVINIFAQWNDKNYFWVLDPPHIPVLSDLVKYPYTNLLYVVVLMIGSAIIITLLKFLLRLRRGSRIPPSPTPGIDMEER
jgi:hypothetical protein